MNWTYNTQTANKYTNKYFYYSLPIFSNIVWTKVTQIYATLLFCTGSNMTQAGHEPWLAFPILGDFIPSPPRPGSPDIFSTDCPELGSPI